MNRCPCCDQTLTQEFRQKRLTWYCRHCWQEMPNLEAMLLKSYKRVLEVPTKSLTPVAA
jgi:ribosomal protein L37AE/L43A